MKISAWKASWQAADLASRRSLFAGGSSGGNRPADKRALWERKNQATQSWQLRKGHRPIPYLEQATTVPATCPVRTLGPMACQFADRSALSGLLLQLPC